MNEGLYSEAEFVISQRKYTDKAGKKEQFKKVKRGKYFCYFILFLLRFKNALESSYFLQSFDAKGFGNNMKKLIFLISALKCNSNTN